MGLHVIPCHLQKWVEAFQDSRTPSGSLDIASLNLSNAKRSVWFPNVEEVAAFELKMKMKRRYKNVANIFIWLRNKIEEAIRWWDLDIFNWI